jgi:transposase
MVVTVGSDSHKSTHTFVAADANGRELGKRTVQATTDGHLEALRWAKQWPGRRWALEDCRHLTRRLEADLLRAGERVVRVPPKLMAGARRGARTRGKSDPIDALAVARAALREPGLPVARLEGASREVRVLVDHREDLVRQRTGHQSRLRWHLHELEPGYQIAARSLDRSKTLNKLEAILQGHRGAVARVARQLVDQIRSLTVAIKELDREIGQLVTPRSPHLVQLVGCGTLTAAKIVGETAGVGRFRSRGAYAMQTGSAPIPVWSGNDTRHRLNRGGNRQLNAALHRIAVTQLQHHPPAIEYVRRRTAGGENKTEAIRALRRRISDAVYRCLVADERLQQAAHGQMPAAT